MNKRKIIILVVISIAVLSLGLMFFIFSKEKPLDNSSVQSSVNGKHYKETENSISFKSGKEITENREKIININPFQKAEIIIYKADISGELDINVIEKETSSEMNKKLDIATNREIIKIAEGLGEYIVKIEAEKLTGEYNINWNIKPNNNTEVYTSTKGYELEYDPSKFQIINENGKEKFKYANDEEDVYFMIEVVENEKIAEIKQQELVKDNSIGECKITEANLSGKYREKRNGNMINQKMFFEISENKMIIIEINSYDKNKENVLIEEHIKNMMKTFKYN